MSDKRLGPYRIEKVLGRGGMGTVYKAVADDTNEVVAVKVLAENFSDDTHFRGRFESEIETMKKLEHENIVKIIGYGEERGQLFFSMEFVNGPSLFDVLKAGKRFTWREVAQIGIGICRALNHAHVMGVIHRDLKPGNLLMDENRNVKLTDFGIAKLFGGTSRTRDGGVLGTADYMSPEQAQGQPASNRSDIYSLGSVLYALLARRPPFQSTSLAQTIKNLSFEKPTPILNVAPDTPPELAKLIDQLLEKEPEKRVGTARSVAKRLHAILTDVSSGPTLVEDADFVVAQEVGDANRTVVPDTIDAVRPTAPIPSAEKGSLPSRSTELAPTIVATRPGTAVDANGVAVEASTPEPARTFTVVDEAQRQRAQTIESSDDDHGPVWPYVVALVLLVGLGVGGFAYQYMPQSAEALLSAIDNERDGGADQLVNVKDELEDFVTRFPDHERVDEIRGYLAFVERAAAPRRIRLKFRLRGFAALSPPEQHFFEALQFAETDPEKAARHFQSLITIYESLPDQPESARCIEGARAELEKLNKSIEQFKVANRLVIKQAIEKAKQADVEKRRQIINALIERFGDRAWAADLMTDAKSLLNP